MGGRWLWVGGGRGGRGTVEAVSTAYQVLVLFHILCVLGGFGALAYNGLFLSLARRRGAGGVVALDVNAQLSTLAELLVMGVLLFGVAAVAASSSRWGFGQAWVGAAIALFVVDIGVLHGLIKPTQRRYLSLARALEAAPAAGGGPGSGGGGPSEAERAAGAAQLTAFERRASLGWAIFNLLVVAAVYLMVFKPGA